VKLKCVEMWLCEDCLAGKGELCNTPGCALCRMKPLEWALSPELYNVVEEFDENDVETPEKRRGHAIRI
jgi:hypothetical protein